MFWNFIKVAIRSIRRQKVYSLINVAGLGVGLASSIMITLFILHELSYDRFHTKRDRIYRLCVKGKIGEQEMNMAFTAMPTAEAFNREFPEITSACRLDPRRNVYFRHGDKTFIENNVLWADSTFFRIFDFRLLEGDPEKVLTEPNTLVLTRDMARKYFGTADPVGQSISVFRDSSLYRITGVVENCPENSHISFDFILSFHSRNDANRTMWLAHNINTYFLLAPGADVNLLEEKIQPVMLKYVGPEVEQFLGVQLDQWLEEGNSYGMYLQALGDIHLDPDVTSSFKEPHEKKYLHIFGLIAVFILVIACINFMNLSTARSSNRAREVGMRKVLGSSRNLLTAQFLGESVLLAGIAMILAVCLVNLLLPAFDNMIRLNLSYRLPDPVYGIPLLIVLVLLVGLAAGSYPAFYLSSFRPVAVLTGKLATGMKTGYLRNILVVLQFAISIGIIISTLVVGRQIRYMLNKDLGYEKEQMLIINRMGAMGVEHIQAFKEEIGRLPGVVASSNSTMIMGLTNNSNAYMIEGQPFEQSPVLATNWVDYDFASTYGLELVNGRFLSPEFAGDSTGAVINEAAVKVFNTGNPIGIRLIEPGRTPEERTYHRIVGVVRDFNFESLHTKIMPYVFLYKRPGMDWGGYLTVRLRTDDMRSSLARIEKTWKEFSHNQPFEYSFADENFARTYEEEVRTGKIFMVFGILAILVACLGLLGLSGYTTEQRTREIGVRKVMGADPSEIVRLLSRETILLVLLAALLSVPVAWYFMGHWLESFAYRINLSPGVFLLAILGALFIALLTVSYQAVSAALKNPADSLRYE